MSVVVKGGEDGITVHIGFSAAPAMVKFVPDVSPSGQTMDRHVVERGVALNVASYTGKVVKPAGPNVRLQRGYGLHDVIGIVFRFAALWEVRRFRGGYG